MTSWPTAPLIRIIRGKVDGSEIANELAAHRSNGEYVLFSAKHWYWTAADNCYDDSIDDWEEVTAVPTAHLKALKEAWWGPGGENTKWLRNVEDAMTPILDCLPANKPSTIDRAVTRVKDTGGPMISGKDSNENRISLLFDALASIAVATNKAAPLAIVARICVDWADIENPRRDSLEVTRERSKALSDPGSLIVLSTLVGDVTTALCENLSPRHDLIDVAAYALAWAAQIIEEEDK